MVKLQHVAQPNSNQIEITDLAKKEDLLHHPFSSQANTLFQTSFNLGKYFRLNYTGFLDHTLANGSFCNLHVQCKNRLSMIM